MSMDDYYREYILDHYRNPRNYGTLENPTAHAEDSNPLCGDQLAIDLVVEGDRVSEVRFKGRGCAISQARTKCAFLSLRVLHRSLAFAGLERPTASDDEDTLDS